LLSLGRFEEGLRDYEFRAAPPIRQRLSARGEPQWSGQADIAGKTLLLYQENFSGDALQFCRYLLLAERRRAKIVLVVQRSLKRLMRSLSPTITIISEDDPLPPFDYHASLMSLPLAFRTTLETIFAEVPYLRAERDRVRTWRERLGGHGVKIGVCWQGSTLAYALALGRSCAVEEFLGLSRIPGVRLIALQKSDGLEQLSDMPPGMVETPGPDFDAGPDAFLDCAAVMETLDLVVTVDTSIAHLAGALRRPTWVALKYIPD
jgi:hypothetical protein